MTGSNITFTPTQANSSNGGLSGGAIAGIVVGVLLGIAILLLICFYCCLRGLWDGFWALLGMGKRRRRTERTEYIEEHRHTSYAGDGRVRRTWYGTPKRVERRDERKSKSGGNLLGIAAGLAGLWAILGVKRNRDNKRRSEKSEYTESSYGSYYTSESEY